MGPSFFKGGAACIVQVDYESSPGYYRVFVGGDAGIHEPPNRSEFLRKKQESTDG